MSITHAIRTDSGKQIGFGHLKRCLILADAIRERKGIPKIVLGQADSDTISIMENSKHIWSQLNEADHFALQPIAGEAKVIILDLSHKQTRPQNISAQAGRFMGDSFVAPTYQGLGTCTMHPSLVHYPTPPIVCTIHL